MENLYSLETTAICPVDKKVDKYRIYIKSEKMIPVEKIKAVLLKMEKKQIYQEDLTKLISEQLDAHVRLEAMHSGVFVRSIYP